MQLFVGYSNKTKNWMNKMGAMHRCSSSNVKAIIRHVIAKDNYAAKGFILNKATFLFFPQILQMKMDGVFCCKKCHERRLQVLENLNKLFMPRPFVAACIHTSAAFVWFFYFYIFSSECKIFDVSTDYEMNSAYFYLMTINNMKIIN